MENIDLTAVVISYVLFTFGVGVWAIWAGIQFENLYRERVDPTLLTYDGAREMLEKDPLGVFEYGPREVRKGWGLMFRHQEDKEVERLRRRYLWRFIAFVILLFPGSTVVVVSTWVIWLQWQAA